MTDETKTKGQLVEELKVLRQTVSELQERVIELEAVEVERAQAEEKLRKSEDRFRAMFETMTEGVALHEIIYNREGAAVDYTILDVNPAYQTHTGIDRENAPGRRASELYGSGVAPFLDIYGQVAATGESIRFETYFEPMQKHFSISVFSPIAGQFATVFKDITERKRAEEELRQYRDHLEELVTERTAELEKANAELSQYAYVVSHDLRAPIRAINGYSLFLQEDCMGQLGDDCLEYIQGIAESARRMDALVVDLLEYSRIGRIQIEKSEVDTGKLLEQIATNLNLEKQARVILPTSAPVIRAQSMRLEQIFTNLLSNAVKFHRPDTDSVIAVEWADRGDRWEFSVRDNGIGIEEQHQKTIFGIFQRLHTQEEYEGTGIGLAIVRKVVEEHGGQVWVQSTPGQGAVFSFTLPKQIQED
jgi:PAS domain S-box-containing protein